MQKCIIPGCDKAGTHGDVSHPNDRYCVDHKTPLMDLLIASRRPTPHQKRVEEDGA